MWQPSVRLRALMCGFVGIRRWVCSVRHPYRGMGTVKKMHRSDGEPYFKILFDTGEEHVYGEKSAAKLFVIVDPEQRGVISRCVPAIDQTNTCTTVLAYDPMSILPPPRAHPYRHGQGEREPLCPTRAYRRRYTREHSHGAREGARVASRTSPPPTTRATANPRRNKRGPHSPACDVAHHMRHATWHARCAVHLELPFVTPNVTPNLYSLNAHPECTSDGTLCRVLSCRSH